MDYEKKYKEALEIAKQFSEKPYLEDGNSYDDVDKPSMVFKAGANYVLDEIENFMKDLDLGNSSKEKFYKLDVIANIGLFIEQLKK